MYSLLRSLQGIAERKGRQRTGLRHAPNHLLWCWGNSQRGRGCPVAHRREGRGQSRPWPVSIRLQEWRNPNRMLGLTFRWLSGSIREEQVPMGLSHQDPLCVHGVFGMNPLEEVAATGSHLSPPGPCRALGDPPHWLSKTRNLRNDKGDPRRGASIEPHVSKRILLGALFQGERRHRKERQPVVVLCSGHVSSHTPCPDQAGSAEVGVRDQRFFCFVDDW